MATFNTSDSIKVGSVDADKVYMGLDLVWSPSDGTPGTQWGPQSIFYLAGVAWGTSPQMAGGDVLFDDFGMVTIAADLTTGLITCTFTSSANATGFLAEVGTFYLGSVGLDTSDATLNATTVLWTDLAAAQQYTSSATEISGSYTEAVPDTSYQTITGTTDVGSGTGGSRDNDPASTPVIPGMYQVTIRGTDNSSPRLFFTFDTEANRDDFTDQYIPGSSLELTIGPDTYSVSSPSWNNFGSGSAWYALIDGSQFDAFPADVPNGTSYSIVMEPSTLIYSASGTTGSGTFGTGVWTGGGTGVVYNESVNTLGISPGAVGIRTNNPNADGVVMDWNGTANLNTALTAFDANDPFYVTWTWVTGPLAGQSATTIKTWAAIVAGGTAIDGDRTWFDSELNTWDDWSAIAPTTDLVNNGTAPDGLSNKQFTLEMTAVTTAALGTLFLQGATSGTNTGGVESNITGGTLTGIPGVTALNKMQFRDSVKDGVWTDDGFGLLWTFNDADEITATNAVVPATGTFTVCEAGTQNVIFTYTYDGRSNFTGTVEEYERIASDCFTGIVPANNTLVDVYYS